jgi:hypothetical protein
LPGAGRVVKTAAAAEARYLAGNSGALLLLVQSSRKICSQYFAMSAFLITTLASRFVSTPSVDQFWLPTTVIEESMIMPLL